MSIIHNVLGDGENHPVTNFTYATAAAREGAVGLTSADIMKTARQSDDNSVWILLDDTGPLWSMISHGYVQAIYDATAGIPFGTTTGLGVLIPDNAYIIKAFYDVLITFTSATDAATIQLGINTDSAAGLVAPIAISAGGNPWDAGPHDCLPDGTAAAFIPSLGAGDAQDKTTGIRELEAVNAGGENLTAGKLNLFIEYQVSV